MEIQAEFNNPHIIFLAAAILLAALTALIYAIINTFALWFINNDPIDMILYCPNCKSRHIDIEEPWKGWNNPPHKSHLCDNCGTIWRPADIPTNGVAKIKTYGKNDTIFFDK